MLANAADPIQLIRRQVVAQQVAAVVGEPELLRPRLPVEADRVADAEGDVLAMAAVRIHAQDLCVAIAIADVAGRANWHIQLAVRAKGDEFPAMMGFTRQVGNNHLESWCLIEMLLDVAQGEDLADRRDIQITVVEGDAHRHVQASRDHAGLFRATVVIRIAQRVDLARAARTDKHRAFRADCKRARIRHIGRIDGDVETGGNPQLLDRRRILRPGRGRECGEQDGRRDQARPECMECRIHRLPPHCVREPHSPLFHANPEMRVPDGTPCRIRAHQRGTLKPSSGIPISASSRCR